ncbi:MAG: hypothetical protein J6331_10425, partial [Lentisphaeria bacterium]|nr:hypothetical protein [Lentisphaeria bacterium]
MQQEKSFFRPPQGRRRPRLREADASICCCGRMNYGDRIICRRRKQRKQEKERNEMKKSAMCVLLSLCSLIVLSAREPDLTEGLWNVSIPENSGEITPSGTSFRFKTDGTAEPVY